MDFEDARRILRGFDLPRGGFEDVLAKLDLLKGSTPADEAPGSRCRQPPKLGKLKSGRAA